MTKNEYLAELKAGLTSLPSEERDAAVKYYQEFFEDAGDGNEQEVISELGSPKALAESIIGETNRTEKSSTEYIPANPGDIRGDKSDKTQNNQRDNSKTALLIILLVALSPVIIPIAASIFGIFIGILAVAFSLWVACGAIVLALTVGGIAAVIAGICMMFGSPLEGILAIGVGLILMSVGLLLLIPFISICTKLIPAMVRGFVNLFSNIFHRSKVTA